MSTPPLSPGTCSFCGLAASSPRTRMYVGSGDAQICDGCVRMFASTMDERDRQVRFACAFCLQPQAHVSRLVAGPGGIYICDECTALCFEIISEEGLAPPRA